MLFNQLESLNAGENSKSDRATSQWQFATGLYVETSAATRLLEALRNFLFMAKVMVGSCQL